MFADWLNVDRSVVHRWLSGERMPNPEMQDLIRRKTSDEVTPNDFHDQWRRRHPQAPTERREAAK
jgi:hypothetical protein